ncbi:UDP-N-acetylmuramoyl-tripeptide--D-alanyl-D-alanine ligase [Neobacillus rhizosphaerae]|uniref:UDP-N-acetylmuramoyl-tripeptide--D-alanyl-D-alanine ligase n=1 Tax=Neobacillus rhizosphaerae TaxID=2880965 RepID=A0ABM9EPS5_9BACI|nr:UDP-N-acetylmuramoyl-tripeptide--D-alanyl-D-alanine ligase [Neobacillus rhizosphaerae]CAH2714589.1 UDP-N-acetylmuramoyl-tripeptide--D-alanyl-D-alanine ligase [Neobacillus rhizosphaerae]
MKPLSVRRIRTTLAGELIQGSDYVIIHYGAYRLKQIKEQNTILFSNKRIVNWEGLKRFFPLVLVTDQEFSKNGQLEDLTVIKVKDTEEAYWKFVNYYRSLFQIPVVAITGTSGKTTTKEMIKHILSADKIVTSTNSSNNSRTAHLHYLLSIDDDIEAAVFETAVGAPGDVLKAGEYFKPTIGIITNIGAHHLNYCQTLEAYIHSKGEMARALNNSGVLIINAEDKNSRKIDLTNYHGRIIKVGIDSSCHYKAIDIQYCKDGMQFSVQYEQNTYPMFVPGFGEHQVYNALAAIAAVHEIGVDLMEIADRLKTFQNLNKHLQVYEGMNGSTILDDTWSMTTTSLEAALKVLNELGKEKKRVAILGTITDLGSWGYVIHEQAGEIICEKGVDVLITIGEHARIMADHAVENGLNAQVYTFKNSPLAYDLLTKIVDQETIVLIKGDMYSKAIIDLASKLRKKK